MFATRRFAARAAIPRSSALFHSSRPNFVKVGDAIPSIELMETSPGSKVNLAKELSGKGVIIGVPGAFTPVCSASHVPGFIQHPKLKDAGKVFVVSVNDPFVMKAWGEILDPGTKSGIRFLGDPAGKFSEELDVLFDSVGVFGHKRSKRYALVVENGKVKSAFVEPDNTGMDVSTAEKVLG